MKRTLRKISCLLFILVTFTLCSSVSFASSDVVASGELLDGNMWEYTADHDLYFYATESDSLYVGWDDVPWQYESGDNLIISGSFDEVYCLPGDFDFNKIIVREGVREIKGLNAGEEIELPMTVTNISNSAFLGNGYLESISIPGIGVKIGAYAFGACTSLARVELARGVCISSWAFSNCYDLREIDIPAGSYVEREAFIDSGLTEVTINSKDVSLESYAFGDNENLKIYCHADSRACEVALENGYKIECLSCKMIAIPGVTPTCERSGLTEGQMCYACKRVAVEQEEVPAKGHQYGGDYICDNCGYENEALKPVACTHAWQSATCTTAKTCTKCKITEGAALGHNPDVAQATVKATTSKDGKMETKCTRCNAVLKTVAIKKASKVLLSTDAYTYNGKTKSPKIVVKDSAGKTISSNYYTVSKPSGRKAIGKYTYTVKFKGNYSGTQKLTLTIKPVKPTIQTPKAEKKAITVKWKKGSKSQVSGYEVMVATNSKFSKNKKTASVKGYSKTSCKISKLKAKTKYYVKVRTYKTVKGVKIYSDWSKVKTIKTK